MIHRAAIGIALMLSILSAVSMYGAVSSMSKDLFLLAAQYLFWAIISSAVGGACAWLKFELTMSGLRGWHKDLRVLPAVK